MSRYPACIRALLLWSLTDRKLDSLFKDKTRFCIVLIAVLVTFCKHFTILFNRLIVMVHRQTLRCSAAIVSQCYRREKADTQQGTGTTPRTTPAKDYDSSTVITKGQLLICSFFYQEQMMAPLPVQCVAYFHGFTFFYMFLNSLFVAMTT